MDITSKKYFSNGKPRNETLFSIHNINVHEIINVNINHLEWSTRTINCFGRMGIHFLNELLELSPAELIKIKNLGRNSLEEIEGKISYFLENNVNQDNSYFINRDFVEGSEALYQKYGIEMKDINKLNLFEIGWSNRVINIFKSNGIKEFSDLLKYNTFELSQLKNLGKTSLNEIERNLNRILESRIIDDHKRRTCEYAIPKELFSHIDDLVIGNLKFLDTINRNNCIDDFIERYAKEFQIIDENLRIEAYFGEEKILHITDALKTFYCMTEKTRNYLKLIKHEIENLQPRYLGYLVTRFTQYYKDRELDSLFRDYNPAMELGDSLGYYNLIVNHGADYRQIIDFLKWVSKDINNSITEFIENTLEKERDKIILNGRSRNESLEVVGNKLNITRERVRQVERKLLVRGSKWIVRESILQKLHALTNDSFLLCLDSIEQEIHSYRDEFFYILHKHIKDKCDYSLVPEINSIVRFSQSELINLYNHISKIPSYFEYTSLDVMIENITEIELERLIIKKYIKKNFSRTGRLFHQKKLTLTEKYRIIFREFFSEGIRVYNEKEIKLFRQKLNEYFGETELPENNRAISIRLTEIGILVGRGKYKIIDKIEINNNLVNAIKDYILDSGKEIMLTSSIFQVFEGDLKQQMIVNHNHLHGILKEVFKDEFYFKKDYIMKNKTDKSMSDEIEDYIMRFDYPIDISQIKNEFPGVTQAIIGRSITMTEVVNLFGKYIHLSKLNIDSNDESFMKRIIDEIISDSGLHHAEELYNRIDELSSGWWKKFFVDYPFGAFSIAEALFDDMYQFSRPFFSKFGVEVENRYELLTKVIEKNPQVSIRELHRVVKNYNLKFPSIKSIIDFALRNHYLIDKYTLIKESELSLSKDDIKKVESLLKSYVQNEGTSLIRLFPYISELPTINFGWNEWIIFSLVERHSHNLEVGLTSNFYDRAFPIVSFKGKMDYDKFKDVKFDDEYSTLIDFNNIEELIDELDLTFVYEE